MNTFCAENFTNSLGQELSPGDEVVFVATCCKRTYINRGKFDGVYKDRKGRIAGVRVGNVAYQKYVWDRTTRTGKYVDSIRKSVLPLARVFKYHTAVADLAEGRVKI